MPTATPFSAAVTFEVMDLLLGLLIVAGAAALIVLVIVLVKLIGTLGRINRLIEDIDAPIQATVKQLPETIKSVNNVMGNVQDLSDDVTVTLPAVLQDVTQTTEALKLSVASASLTITDLTELLSNGLGWIKGRTGGAGPSRMTGIVRNAASAAGAYAGARRRLKRKH